MNACSTWDKESLCCTQMILVGPHSMEVDSIIEEIKKASLDLTVERGDISGSVGVRVGIISAPLNRIKLITSSRNWDWTRTRRLPRTTGASSKSLLRNTTAEHFGRHFGFCSVIGKLNYPEQCNRINVTCTSTHQCTRFVSKPKDVNGRTVRWIGRD